MRARRAFATLVSLSFLDSNSSGGDGGIVEVFYLVPKPLEQIAVARVEPLHEFLVGKEIVAHEIGYHLFFTRLNTFSPGFVFSSLALELSRMSFFLLLTIKTGRDIIIVRR